jgi:hypothetical protein
MRVSKEQAVRNHQHITRFQDRRKSKVGSTMEVTDRDENRVALQRKIQRQRDPMKIYESKTPNPRRVRMWRFVQTLVSLAVVELPVRVPFGFHGDWIADQD